jgi:hypothetical protein
MTGYAETYRRSLERAEEFWAEAAGAIDWEQRWDRVLDASRPPLFRWFPGASLNTCWNAVDRHVAAGRGERVALIWHTRSPARSGISPIVSCARRSRVWRACWGAPGSSRATAS